MPTFNEERRLKGCFLKLHRLASEQGLADNLEVIVVDDGSDDGTVKAARDQLELLPRGRLLRLPRHAGKGAAIRLGVAAAAGDAIAFMDADLATELSALPRAVEALNDADIAIGSRAVPGAVVTGRSRVRAILHYGFRAQVRHLAGVLASDPQCGFKAFRGEVAKELFGMSRVDGFAFDVEILVLAQQAGYTIVEIPIRWHAVDGSHVRLIRDSLAVLGDVVRVRLRHRHMRRIASSPPTSAGGWTPSAPPDPVARAPSVRRLSIPATASTGHTARNDRLRIAFVSWRDLAHPQAGGSEMLIDQLARTCVERGHNVGLMCGSPTGSRSYEVVPLGGPYGQYLWAPVAYARRFRGWDVLVDTENGIPFFSPLWRRGPVVCLVHHVHREQWRLRFPKPIAAFGRALEERAMPLVYRRAMFLCVSPSTALALGALGVPSKRIRLLPMGVPAVSSPFEDRAPSPLFLALGRLVPHKRLDLLLRIWESVRPHVGGRLVVAGDGPERARLERLAGEGVEIRGKVSDDEKQRLLRRAWLLTHSALHEGWGMALTEAAAAGTPALAFDVPGVRDAVRNQETGVLVGSKEEFTREWIALAQDPQRRELMGAAARRHVGSTPWTATVDAFLAVLEEATRGVRTTAQAA